MVCHCCGGELKTRSRALPEEQQRELESRLGGPPPKHRKKRILKKLTKRWEAEREIAIQEARLYSFYMSTLPSRTLVCSSCGRAESTTMAVVRSMFPIQQLPPGAKPIYLSEPIETV